MKHGLILALKTALFSLLTILASSSALSQDITNPLNIGLPKNGDFSGSDFESVQLNNGNLHIEIPLWTIPGRGLPVGFKYVYDDKGYYFSTTCDRYGFCHDHVKVEPFNLTYAQILS